MSDLKKLSDDLDQKRAAYHRLGSQNTYGLDNIEAARQSLAYQRAEREYVAADWALREAVRMEDEESQ